MKKFNIRKVLDGLTAASSSSSSATAQPGTPKENDVVQETLQSEHFQLCKVGLPVNAANIRLFFLFIWDDCCVTEHLFSCVSTAYYVGCKITKNICEGGFEGSAVHLLKYKSWYNSMDNVSDCAAYLFHGCIQSCHSELLVCVALNPRLQSPFLHSKSAWSTSHFWRPTELWMLHISAYLLQHTCTPFKAFIGFYINSSVAAGL